jgi:serpin B
MILFGARGPTAVELGNAIFRTDDQFVALNITASTVLRLRSLLHRLSHSNGTTLSNNVFIDRNFHLTPDFMLSTKEFFKANIASIDFSDEKAKKTINSVIGATSESDLQNALDYLSPNTKLLLLNILIFKREWKYKFDLRRSKKRPFLTQEGEQILTDTMLLTNTIETGMSEEMNCTAVKLPFRGGSLAFVALLPRPGMSVNELISNLNVASLSRLLEHQMQRSKTKVIIPKFRMEWSDSLVQPLRRIGINRIFDAQDANFSGISDHSSGLFVGDLRQKVVVSIDENGSKASAATSASFRQRSLSLDDEFIINRPFVFMIGLFNRKSLSDVLFLGKYLLPPS